jgi:hypothetical protein
MEGLKPRYDRWVQELGARGLEVPRDGDRCSECVSEIGEWVRKDEAQTGGDSSTLIIHNLQFAGARGSVVVKALCFKP